MKVLITGGTGFIGANLARKLLKKGDLVGLIVREQSKEWRIKDISKNVKKIYADITNKEQTKKAIKNYKPDFIFHLASYGAYPKTQKDSEIMFNTNVNGTKNIAEYAEEIPIINVGSSSEYGIKNKPMKETDICNPNNEYGRTKLIQTQYCQSKEIPTLRIFSVYGPWEDANRLIPTLIKAKLKGLPLKLINSVREYAYVEDITDAFLIASEKYNHIRGDIINIGSGKQISMKEVLNAIDNLNKRNLRISWDFTPLQYEPSVWEANIEKAKKILNWEPKYSFKEGLKETYEWWENFLNKRN